MASHLLLCLLYFVNCTFALYCFGFALNGTSYIILRMGCCNLKKFFCMYSSIEMYMVLFL